MKKYRGWLAALIVLCSTGCSHVAYYGQATLGQLEVLNARQPVAQLLADPATPETLRQRLLLSQQIRAYAIEQGHLPESAVFTSYSDLKRPYVTWVVIAAPKLSLTPKTWCFPIAGCTSYKGYFAPEKARALAVELQSDGYDTYLGGVPAYSTLGWFADPLLNTFIDYPDMDLARLIFHEYAHQLVYVKDDSAFNEAFATAVEIIITERWLQSRADNNALENFQRQRQREKHIIALILDYRDRLQDMYASDLSETQKLKAKSQLFMALTEQYDVLAGRRLESSTNKQEGIPFHPYYDAWMALPLNNALMVGVVTYNDLVAKFIAAYNQHDKRLAEFYAAMQALAELPASQRQVHLSNYQLDHNG